jgi:imidazoleglycerol phosphate dehydratase HisB
MYQFVNDYRFGCLFFAARRVFSLRQFDAAAVPAVSGLTKIRLDFGGPCMAKVTLSRRRTKRRHLREKATIDHLVRAVFEKTKGTVHAPFTLSGLSVEEQIRKEWHPSMGGLALF